jgi:hypothetical protein
MRSFFCIAAALAFFSNIGFANPTALTVETGVYCVVNDIPELSSYGTHSPCEIVIESTPTKLVLKTFGPTRYNSPVSEYASYYDQLPEEETTCNVITPSLLNECFFDSVRKYYIMDQRSFVRTWGAKVAMVKVSEIPSEFLTPNLQAVRRFGPLVP